MESTSSRHSFSTIHSDSDSTSLSEVEDEWSEKINSLLDISSFSLKDTNSIKPFSATVQRGFSRCRSFSHDHVTGSEIKPKQPSKLVTCTAGGKVFILPFEILDDGGDEKEFSSEDRHQWADEPTDNSLDTETVMRNMNRCGDYSFAKTDKSQLGKEADKNLTVQPVGQPNGNIVKREEVKSAKFLKVSKRPVHCPISECRELVCAAFFSTHLKADHFQMLRGKLDPGQTYSILVDPVIEEYGVCRCNVAYYLGGKLRDFGSSEFKDYLPVLLMSTKFKFNDSEVDESEQDGGQQYLFWLTGIVSEHLKIEYTLTVGSHKSQSGFIYPLGQPQEIASIFESGAGLIISQQQISRLLSSEDNLLQLGVTLR
ncbi:uncharacterized protein LOC131437944 [Malaya genurostris]|uniref:uncharacterized protein LOC131437944 n=1 Tax=Malaya genurostris TaxID=325434 RepID=UPI0026F3F35A|nr:uncharacterized protein LOC131437944 [Malaya genurostris]